MRIAGVIAEFNPFHTGHKYLLDSIRALGFSHIAVCLSSDITQRGDIAFFDKRTRAVCALKNGADLVLELPFPFSMSCSEIYAQKSVEILKSVGIDALVFGSETSDENMLLKAAEISSSLKESDNIKQLLKDGKSYPDAFYSAVKHEFGEQTAQIFNSPNATLGIEYIKALGKTPFYPVLRTIPHDSEEVGKYACASKIRSELSNGSENALKYLPYEAKGFEFSDIKKVEGAIIFSLCKKTESELLNICDINEELASRIQTASKQASNYNELISLVKTKNYTMSRIKRCILNAYLGVTKDDLSLVPYVRPIAATDRGIEILSAAPKKTETSLKALEKTHPRLCRFSYLTSKLFDLCCKNPSGANEYTKPFITVNG